MKYYINDRYVKGAAIFEREGDFGKMSYRGTALPLNGQYEFEGKMWRVVSIDKSEYNSGVFNATLEIVNGG